LIEDLCAIPIFRGARADRIRELIRPFDEHFARQAAEAGVLTSDDLADAPPRLRRHGLG
jgi:hypothetical protein